MQVYSPLSINAMLLIVNAPKVDPASPTTYLFPSGVIGRLLKDQDTFGNGSPNARQENVTDEFSNWIASDGNCTNTGDPIDSR